MRYHHFHLEDGGSSGFAHVDAVFGDLVQCGEVRCFYMGRRFLADAVQSSSLFGAKSPCKRPGRFVEQQEQLLVHESEEDVRLLHSICPCLRT